MKRYLIPVLALLAGFIPVARAVNFPGLYSENFDSMGTAGTAPPSGWSVYGAFSTNSATWTSTIPASGVVGGTVTTALTALTTYTTSSNTNGFNYATTTATADRSLGTSPTSGAGVALQLSLTNTSGAAVNSLQIRYDTRRFAAGSATNELPGYWLFYSLDNGTTWTSVPATNPTITTVPNTTGVTTVSPTSVSLSSTWANNGTLLLRWMDDNAQQSSPDQVIGLDNVSIATPPTDASKTALFMNGATQYATMGAATGTLGASSFTIECWFQRTGTGATTTTGNGGATNAIPLVTKGRGEAEASNVDCNYFLGIDSVSNKLCADFEAQAGAPGITAGQNYPIFGNTVITSNVWHHAAATYNTSTFTWNLYLDGVLDSTFTNPTGATPRNDSIQHFGIGSAFTSTGVAAGFFQGVIDEARVWNVARSLTQINATRSSEITASTTGLLACYGMNEGTGSSIGGVVSGAPSGTVANTPLWVSGAPAVTDAPPTISLTAPISGSNVIFPASINLAATAADSDGTVAKVEFFNGATKLGESAAPPYTYSWAGAAAGTYSLTALATDNLGVSTSSSVVTVNVISNPNQPPVVTVSSPANNATGIGASTTLNLGLADNEGDAQTVNFFGRVTTPAVAGSDFTFIAIPDTQYYSENTNRNPSSTGNATIDTGANSSIYNAQTQWIVNNRDTLNIPFVSHMGDIAENGDALESEWIVADGAMSRLENPASTLRAHGIPWGVAPGNHDQQPVADAGGVTNFYTKYFNFTRWNSRPYFGGHYGMKRTLTSDPAPNYQANTNNYELFSSGGLDFIIVHMEYDARAVSNYQAVLDWADALLKVYPNRRAIITSHWIINTGNPASFSTQGQAIYDTLKNNPNLFLMLCGHVNGEGFRSDTYQGRTVYSILSDYQEIKNGGNGFLRKLTFRPSLNQIHVESYSPTLDRAVVAGDSVPSWTAAYDLTYNMQSSVTAWIPLGTVNVPASGTTASLSWTGLEAGKNYEWYATSNDGINTTTTATNRFSTTAPAAPTITLDSPTNGSAYPLNSTVSITATATDSDGTISKVEFFDAGKKLGEDSTAPYSFNLVNPVPGSHPLTAVATDNSGLDAISSVVTVTVTNAPPTVALTEPDPEEVFNAPASIYMTADAADTDGTIAKVEYYANGTKIGESTSVPSYQFFWNNVYTGSYNLTAKAIDDNGASTVSSPLHVIVNNPDNVPPAVAITTPASGVVFAGNISIIASASDSDGTVSKVEFFNGATKLGESTTAPYGYTWSSVAVGNYTLTAKATDNDGGVTTSTTVPINVQAAPVSFSQNFDSMGTAGTALPSGWSFYGYTVGTNSTWVSSILATDVSGGTANATLIPTTTFDLTNTKSATQGYNFALSTSTSDRALGTSPTTTEGVALQWSVTNTGSSGVTAIRLGYDTRRFTAAGTANELPGYWVFYSLDNGTTWTNIATLNPTLAGPTGVIVPNTTGATTVSPTDIALNSTWGAGSTLLLRWVDDNAVATSADQIVGLDNVSLIATAAQVGASPTVSLTAPLATDSFTAPATITITANAADSDGTVSKVEFYNGATKLGEATSAPYMYSWTGVATGTYSLTARATDSDANTTTSSAVSITVNAAPGSGTLARGPYLQMARPTAMTVRWRSSQAITGRVKYGTTVGSLANTVNEASATTDHVIDLTGLSPNTTYFYSVGSAFDTLIGDATTTFTTPPVVGTAANTRVWVLGDAGTASSNQTAVRDAFYTWTGSRTPNMVLQLGDNAYNSGLDSEFQAGMFNIYGTMLKKTPFWSCLGNHETNQSTSFVNTYPYFDIYTFPTSGECGGVASGTEHYYSFNYGNIHFISLDSMTASRSATGAMATWLTNDLASTTATWIVAFFHHPPYTKGSHNSDTETELIEMRTNILPILENGGVDLVLCGHSHCYERSYLLDGHYGLSTTLTSSMKKNAGDGRPTGNGAYIKPLTGPRDHFGAVYAVAGSSGQISGGSLNHPAHFISLNNLGSLVLDVNGTRLDATFVRENGSQPDTFTMIKQGAADTDGDGISDAYEIANGLNRYVNDAASSSDADGLSNLLEFAFGLNPNVNDNAFAEVNVPGAVLTKRGTPAPWYQTTTNGTDFRVIYIRRKDATEAGLVYTPQFSGDMTTWVTSTTTPTVIADGGEVEAVSIKYPFFAAGKKARFFRVGISSTH